jgi:hypothetical protein
LLRVFVDQSAVFFDEALTQLRGAAGLHDIQTFPSK